jgi:hypothetical protein
MKIDARLLLAGMTAGLMDGRYLPAGMNEEDKMDSR